MAESSTSLESLAPPVELRRMEPVPKQSLGWLTDKLTEFNEGKTPLWWWICFLPTAFCAAVVLPVMLAYKISIGVGVWGNNAPVMWGWDIINFVWWVGVAHAGTLISAMLFLTRQHWRTVIGRAAEAMTVFSVAMAGLYPAIHVGRSWFDWFMFPIPTYEDMWPQFRSPLMWDVFAVSTYFSVSLLFWWLGLIPDFAVLRDKVQNRTSRVLFGLLAMGWRGSNRHWHRYEQSYLILAGLSTPLVLSVHSIISFDFAVSIVPGWNTTIFPPYFVAGAVFAGFAMVLTFAMPCRSFYKLRDLITDRHIDWMAKITLATGLIVAYGYMCEAFFSWYSSNPYEWDMSNDRRYHGPYAWAYVMLIICNVIAPQCFWIPWCRRTIWFNFIICQFVGVGMWLERFVIIPMSLTANYLPSANRMYYPTIWDFGMFLGTIGFFCMMMALFIRFLPIINIFEMKDLLFKIKAADSAREAKAQFSTVRGEG